MEQKSQGLTLEDLRSRKEEILAIARSHYATHVRVVGSVARGEADGKSDVDFLVDMDRNELHGFRYFGELDELCTELSQLLDRSVSVIDAATLLQPALLKSQTMYRQHVAKDAVPL